MRKLECADTEYSVESVIQADQQANIVYSMCVLCVYIKRARTHRRR